ncbi:predicted protein [Histoplasma capsulatum var. duboisii H88]|uniref:Predicted protein n=1 Tax=Ajellomyces capsulatus (strain H88) TaxID=544711 RepID=F0UA81_AJEC8|nr:predicted protein [Histoplasma capsulatum var. duboisii H88]
MAQHTMINRTRPIKGLAKQGTQRTGENKTKSPKKENIRHPNKIWKANAAYQGQGVRGITTTTTSRETRKVGLLSQLHRSVAEKVRQEQGTRSKEQGARNKEQGRKGSLDEAIS